LLRARLYQQHIAARDFSSRHDLGVDAHIGVAESTPKGSDNVEVPLTDVEPATDQIGGDARLQIGERQEEVRLQRRILSMFAEVKALTRGLSRQARGGRTT
jgi:hypothetical protein